MLWDRFVNPYQSILCDWTFKWGGFVLKNLWQEIKGSQVGTFQWPEFINFSVEKKVTFAEKSTGTLESSVKGLLLGGPSHLVSG